MGAVYVYLRKKSIEHVNTNVHCVLCLDWEDQENKKHSTIETRRDETRET